MAKFSIYLPDDIQDHLDEKVAENPDPEVKRNTLIRQAVREWLGRNNNTPTVNQ